MTIRWETGVADPARVAAVQQSGLVGTRPGDAFDRLLELAVEVTGVPRGCITLVDAECTTALSSVGFPEGSPLFAPIGQSFCRFVVGSGRPLILDDAQADPRTHNDPAIDLFGAASWAGYPIADTDGLALGTFCLMDSRPHAWTPTDIHVLATMAKAASSELALRQARADVIAARQEVAGLRSAARRERAALVDHIRGLRASDHAAAPLADAILTRLEASTPATPTGAKS